jgi:VWFA-related protein
LRTVALFLAAAVAFSQQQRPTFSITTNIVVVNVTVTDRNGNPIPNLTTADFQLYEDGKLQKLQAVDYQRLGNTVLPTPEVQLTQRKPEPPGYNPEREKAAAKTDLPSRYQDRRLIAMLFDFSSMQPPEQIRAREAAIKFLRTQMTSSDTVSILAYGTTLQTIQDFTSDRDLLISVINRFRIGDSSENANFADEGADTQDQSGQFVADETEFNIFNADLKLAALEDAARGLAQYPEKKALIFISSGIQKNGVDNQSQLRATVNTAIRANVAFYPIDARGLTALVPGGDATQAGATGNNLYSGSGQRSLKENFNNQQETLATLALDTGGKAVLDSNDLTDGMRQVQRDFGSYYVLSYVSNNSARDGRYRRIQVKLAPTVSASKPKLDYRQGYYAPTSFARMQEADKEAQLSQALMSDNPVTDLALAVEVDYFRLSKDKYFVPINAKIPGSALEFHKKGAKQATELDFIADVLDARNRTAATVRDTIPLKVTADLAGQVSQKSVQYDTGVTLGPGKYTIRFVARENGEGKIGTFERIFTIPDLAGSGAASALRVSSLVLSSGRQPAGSQVAGVKNEQKLLAQNPLLADGQQLVPNVTRVFPKGQDLLAYVEVYDPKIPEGLPQNFQRADVQAVLALYSADRQIYQTNPVRVTRLNPDRPGTLPVSIQAATSSLAPGRYTCQVSLIDEFGRRFAFTREALAIISR